MQLLPPAHLLNVLADARRVASRPAILREGNVVLPAWVRQLPLHVVEHLQHYIRAIALVQLLLPAHALHFFLNIFRVAGCPVALRPKHVVLASRVSQLMPQLIDHPQFRNREFPLCIH